MRGTCITCDSYELRGPQQYVFVLDEERRRRSGVEWLPSHMVGLRRFMSFSPVSLRPFLFENPNYGVINTTLSIYNFNITSLKFIENIRGEQEIIFVITIT